MLLCEKEKERKKEKRKKEKKEEGGKEEGKKERKKKKEKEKSHALMPQPPFPSSGIHILTEEWLLSVSLELDAINKTKAKNL